MIIYKQLDEYLKSLTTNKSIVLEIGGEPGGYLTENVRLKLTSNIFKLNNLDLIYDAHNSPFKDNTFDLIFMVAADYFMKNQIMVFSNAFQNLKNDGQFVIATYKKRVLKKCNGVVHAKGKQEYIDMLKQSGFKHISVRTIYNNPPTNTFKKAIWNVAPRLLKDAHSQWCIYTAKKNN